MKRILSVFAVLALVAAFAGSALAADKMLGAFKLKTGEGKEITLETVKGKPMAFVFAQMACRQCRTELDDLEANKDKFKDKLVVVLVDTNSEAALERYKTKYSMPVIFDPDFSIPEMVQLTTTPSTIVVNKDGKVVYEKIGYVRGQFEEVLKAL